MRDGEAMYGLGQHRTGQLNNAGLSFDFAPRNSQITIPLAHSSEGYSILYNMPGYGQARPALRTGLASAQCEAKPTGTLTRLNESCT